MTNSIIFPKNYVIDMSDAKQALKSTEEGEDTGAKSKSLLLISTKKRKQRGRSHKKVCVLFLFFFFF